MMVETTEIEDRPDAQPLYAQVKDILMRRIHTGIWSPGQLLPSEMRLASELGVSQGTVRKALDTLARASLVERKQGRGTFVLEHTAAQVLFKFFHIYEVGGGRVLPGVGKVHFEARKATSEVASSLSIAERSDIVEIKRVRTHRGNPFMVETVSLPQSRFPDLHLRSELPNTLYDMFQKDYGITVSHIQEDCSAVLATAAQARQLKAKAGTPLLKIDRIAHDIEEMPVERRISFCLTDGLHYRAKLR